MAAINQHHCVPVFSFGAVDHMVTPFYSFGAVSRRIREAQGDEDSDEDVGPRTTMPMVLPLRRDAEPLDPWIADCLLAACACLTEASEDLSSAAGRVASGEGPEVASSRDRLVQFVRGLTCPDDFATAALRGEEGIAAAAEATAKAAAGGDRAAAAAAAAAERVTADHLWGRFVSYANGAGIVRLRRRFEDLDTVSLATGKVGSRTPRDNFFLERLRAQLRVCASVCLCLCVCVCLSLFLCVFVFGALTRRGVRSWCLSPSLFVPLQATGFVGMAQLRRLVETDILPATAAPGAAAPGALTMRTLLQFAALAAARQPPPLELYDDGAAGAPPSPEGCPPSAFGRSVTRHDSALHAALAHTGRASPDGGPGSPSTVASNVDGAGSAEFFAPAAPVPGHPAFAVQRSTVKRRAAQREAAAAVAAAADVRLEYGPLCAAVAADLRRLRKLENAQVTIPSSSSCASSLFGRSTPFSVMGCLFIYSSFLTCNVHAPLGSSLNRLAHKDSPRVVVVVVVVVDGGGVARVMRGRVADQVHRGLSALRAQRPPLLRPHRRRAKG